MASTEPGTVTAPTVSPIPLIVIGASAGGVAALLALGERLPQDLPAAIVIAQHIGAYDGRMPELMNHRCRLRSSYAEDGDVPEPGTIRFAPPDRHVVVAGSSLRLLRTAKENFARPAIDPLFRSAAVEWPGPLIGVILTGMLDDGASGLRSIKESGGTTVVQDPNDAASPSMPRAALAATAVDYCVPIARMADLFAQLARDAMPASRKPPSDAAVVETRLTQRDGNPFELLSQIGRSSRFTCPECGGGLWEMNEKSPRRFRCHTGHAYTERSLEVAQQDNANATMWATLRTLQERAALLGDLVQHYTAAGNPTAAAEAKKLSERCEQVADQLRALLDGLPDSMVTTVPDEPAG